MRTEYNLAAENVDISTTILNKSEVTVEISRLIRLIKMVYHIIFLKIG